LSVAGFRIASKTRISTGKFHDKISMPLYRYREVKSVYTAGCRHPGTYPKDSKFYWINSSLKTHS